jgi:hypothetical protein
LLIFGLRSAVQLRLESLQAATRLVVPLNPPTMMVPFTASRDAAVDA